MPYGTAEFPISWGNVVAVQSKDLGILDFIQSAHIWAQMSRVAVIEKTENRCISVGQLDICQTAGKIIDIEINFISYFVKLCQILL